MTVIFSCLVRPQVKTMANPFAYDEYRKDKIRQKIEESRTQRVPIKVSGKHIVVPLTSRNCFPTSSACTY